jgi:hypothetical protein
MIQKLIGVRYVVPLREGGSLPAVVDTEAGSFVVKFRGAGQGAKALVAELLAAELALALGLAVPTPAVVTLEDGFGVGEPDPEIQDILRGSVGANFGLAYLPGALAFDPAVDGTTIAPELAAAIVWFDAYLTNVDRTVRNPNLLLWRDRLWMIDHGASLYLHHRWEGWRSRIHSQFPPIKDHVLLPFAGDLAVADASLRPLLTDVAIRQTVADVPDEWLGGESEFGYLVEQREAYVEYLVERLAGPRDWLQEAIDAQQRGPDPLGPRLTHRVV